MEKSQGSLDKDLKTLSEAPLVSCCQLRCAVFHIFFYDWLHCSVASSQPRWGVRGAYNALFRYVVATQLCHTFSTSIVIIGNGISLSTVYRKPIPISNSIIIIIENFIEFKNTMPSTNYHFDK